MIYFYKHKKLNEFSQKEIDMLGIDGIRQFAESNGLDFQKVYNEIQNLEMQIKNTTIMPLDISANEEIKSKFDFAVNHYIDFFNNNASYNRQAYVVIGNISSGKSTYASQIEEDTHSIIIDSDRFKCGEQTKNGYFEGLSSFFSLDDRERLQKPCSAANSKVTELISQTGMNIIMPKAPTSYEKLKKTIASLIKNNYDIHLIYFDAPYPDLANRSYLRYLVQEYKREIDPSGKQIHGRFVPISVIKNYGDPCHETFAKALTTGRFKSYKAFFNSKEEPNQEIDLATMEK